MLHVVSLKGPGGKTAEADSSLFPVLEKMKAEYQEAGRGPLYSAFYPCAPVWCSFHSVSLHLIRIRRHYSTSWSYSWGYEHKYDNEATVELTIQNDLSRRQRRSF